MVFLMLGAGGLLFLESGLSSVRPKSTGFVEPLATGHEEVPARLWEDPFTAVARHEEQNGGGESDSTGTTSDDWRDLATSPREGVNAPTRPAGPERRTKPVPSGLEQLKAAVEERRTDESDSVRLLVLPVFVPAGASAVSVEKRRRQRYAVLSAMAAASLVPETRDHIGLLRTTWDSNQTGPALVSENSPGPAALDEIQVPFEWLERDPNIGRESSVYKTKWAVLLWIAEESFHQDPLGMLDQLLVQLLEPPFTGVDIKVIGPASSAGLKDMLSSSGRLPPRPSALVLEGEASPSDAESLESFITRAFATTEFADHANWRELSKHASALRTAFAKSPVTRDHLRLMDALNSLVFDEYLFAEGDTVEAVRQLNRELRGRGQSRVDRASLSEGIEILFAMMGDLKAQQSAVETQSSNVASLMDEDLWLRDIASSLFVSAALNWSTIEGLKEATAAPSHERAQSLAAAVAFYLEETWPEADEGSLAALEIRMRAALESRSGSVSGIADDENAYGQAELRDELLSLSAVLAPGGKAPEPTLGALIDATWGFGPTEDHTGLATAFLSTVATSLGPILHHEPLDPPDQLVWDLKSYLDDTTLIDDPLINGKVREWARELLDSSDAEPTTGQVAAFLESALKGQDDSDPVWAETVATRWLATALLPTSRSESATSSAEPNHIRDRMEIYSTRATSASAVDSQGFDKVRQKLNELLTGEPGSEDIRVYSTAVQDEALAKLLVDEFQRRGMAMDGSKQVVLIGEWDTIYGRAFPKMLAKALPSKRGGRSIEPVRTVSFLRGLDGALPGQEGVASSRERDVEKVSKDEWQSFEYPQGRSQLDYLRRLESELRKLRTSDGHAFADIFAIGVVGSDVYDKQLILQAVRDEFPGKLFFTTDLDAGLFHPSQYHWSRNLLVASGLGLQLHPDLQRRYPPFRESYQTATYLACLAALDALAGDLEGRFDKRHLDLLRPQLFEIGRDGAYPLPDDVSTYRLAIENTDGGAPGPSAGLPEDHLLFNHFVRPAYPEPTSRPEKLWTCLGLLLVLLLFLAAHRERGDALWLVGLSAAAIFSVAVPIAVAWGIGRGSAMEGGLEPFALLQGLSVWPTIIIRWALCGAGVACLVASGYRLWKARSWVEKRLGTSKGNPKEPPADQQRSEMVWATHRRHTYWFWIGLRVLLFTILYGVLGYFLLEGLHDRTLVRGSDAWSHDRWSFAVALGVIALVAFVAMDSLKSCQRMLKMLGDKQTLYAADVRSATMNKLGLSGMAKEDSYEYLDVKIASKYTRAVELLLLWPFLLYLLFLLSHTKFFDDWNWPWQLHAYFAGLGVALLWSASRLRRAAEEVRRGALKRLEASISTVVGDKKQERRHAQLKVLRDHVLAIREGMFAPWSQRPAVQAILVPFGGAGAIAILDMIAKFRL
jgi:hypothetical protein